MATIYEVSKLAGVSLATVSRVMNQSPNVSEKTRKKVSAAMAQLDYRPNSVAQSLASNRSNCVGVLVSELHGPFYGAMIGGIEGELRKANKHIILTAGHSDESREREGIDFLISRNCDALILHVEAVSDRYLTELSKGRIPIVLINRLVPDIEDHCLFLNNELGGYLATKALLDMGHKDIAYISGPLWKSDAKDRFSGHKRALAEHGLSCSPQTVFEGDYLESGGYEGMEHFINEKLPCSALACGNDEMATGAMAKAREHGLNLPAELSIIGFDNVLFSSYTYPKLTTINHPIDDMGHIAAKAILKSVYNIKQDVIPKVFEPRLIARDSIIPLESTDTL